MLPDAATVSSIKESASGRKTVFSDRRPNPSQVGGLEHAFRRHVKPKKQHEIKLLGEVGLSHMRIIVPPFLVKLTA